MSDAATRIKAALEDSKPVVRSADTTRPVVRFYVALCDASKGLPKVGSPRRDVAVDAPLGTPPEVIERMASEKERKPRDQIHVFGTYGGF